MKHFYLTESDLTLSKGPCDGCCYCPDFHIRDLCSIYVHMRQQNGRKWLQIKIYSILFVFGVVMEVADGLISNRASIHSNP